LVYRAPPALDEIAARHIAYAGGQVAVLAGQQVSTCPHASGPALRAWVEGYFDSALVADFSRSAADLTEFHGKHNRENAVWCPAEREFLLLARKAVWKWDACSPFLGRSGQSIRTAAHRTGAATARPASRKAKVLEAAHG
jgi:hypothetical protein